MSVLEILVIIFGLLNLAFAGFLYAHSNKTFVIGFYALISVFASLWSLSTIITAAPLSLGLLRLALAGHYIFGYLAYLSFFWFAIYFPSKPKFNLVPASLMSIGTIIFVLLIPFTTLVFSLEGGNSLDQQVVFNRIGYSMFILMLSLVFFAGLVVLLRKLRAASEQERFKELDQYQIYFAILSNLVAGTLGITLNLILPLYGNFALFYINPIFVTIALIGIGFYNLIRNKLFNVKLVLTEFFTAGIWIISLARLISSQSENDFLINGVIFLAWVFFGIFLIRGVLREIKAREQVEKLAKELESANEKLKEVDQLKSEFLSIASHQLRAPITAIRGYASLILQGDYGAVPELIHEPLSRISDSARNMANSIEDYLNISRIEQHRMKFEKSTFDLADIAKKTVEELEQVAKRRGLSLTLEAGGPVKVTADVGKIKQVVSNLVDNAIKYTEKGSVTVSVKAEGGKARVTVADTGMGIPKEEIGGLFEKFKRARGANQVNTTGTGLGLYVAKQLVEGHQGRIWAESDGPGRGSRFIFELPTS